MPPASMKASFQHLPDTELVRLIQAGYGPSFESMMRRYNQVLYRTARSILKDDSEAENALREALAREIDFATGDAFAFDGERCNRIVAGTLERLEGGNGDHSTFI